MAEPRIKTTIEFDPSDYERLRAYADHHDLGLASAIMGLLDGKLPRRVFLPPSVEDVAKHCKEKGYDFDPESFVAFYESKGWKIGNQPMRNWRAACVTWTKRRNGGNGRKPENGDMSGMSKNVQTRPDMSTPSASDVERWTKDAEDEIESKDLARKVLDNPNSTREECKEAYETLQRLPGIRKP